MILISSCLFGIPCRYDGKQQVFEGLRDVKKRKVLGVEGGCSPLFVPVCPEVLGGLTVPRPPAEILGGGAKEVLSGKAKVMTVNGRNVTEAYIKGAYFALSIGLLFGCKKAILKARSPSCGSSRIYDGSFSRTLRPGDGILAYLLKEHGFQVFTEEDKDLCSLLEIRPEA